MGERAEGISCAQGAQKLPKKRHGTDSDIAHVCDQWAFALPQVHVPGVGDYEVADLTLLDDPCPLPDKDKSRSLNSKERLLHAPVRRRAGARIHGLGAGERSARPDGCAQPVSPAYPPRTSRVCDRTHCRE